jgi:hypothetical protein
MSKLLPGQVTLEQAILERSAREPAGTEIDRFGNPVTIIKAQGSEIYSDPRDALRAYRGARERAAALPRTVPRAAPPTALPWIKRPQSTEKRSQAQMRIAERAPCIASRKNAVKRSIRGPHSGIGKSYGSSNVSQARVPVTRPR